MVNSDLKEKLMKDYDYWLRFQLVMLQVGKKEIILPKLYKVIPEWSNEIHEQFAIRDKEKLLNNTLIREKYHHIFNGAAVYSKLFSLELCRELLHVYGVYQKFNDRPKEDDISEKAQLWRLVKLQEKLSQPTQLKMEKNEFEQNLVLLSNKFIGLGYHLSLDSFNKSFKNLCKGTKSDDTNVEEIYVLESLMNAAHVELKGIQKDIFVQRNKYQMFVDDCKNGMKNLAQSAEEQKKADMKEKVSNVNWSDLKLNLYSNRLASEGTEEELQDNSVDNIDNDGAENGGNRLPPQESSDDDRNCHSKTVNQNVATSSGSSAAYAVGNEGSKVPHGVNEELKNEAVKLPDVPLDKTDFEAEKIIVTLCVGDLSYDTIEQLAEKLDTVNVDSYNCVGLAQRLELDEDTITYLRLCRTGGGFPAQHFMENLMSSRASTPVDDLIKIVNSVKFDERLLSLLQPFSGKTVREISHDAARSIAVKLTQEGTTLKGWKSVASDLEYSLDEIALIEATRRENGVYSPTEGLFQILRMEKPKLQLLSLVDHLDEMKNHAAKKVLEEFTTEKVLKETKKRNNRKRDDNI